MPNTTVSSTLSNAILSDGETISGTWTDTYNSSNQLTGVSGVNVTLSENGQSAVYTSGTVYIPAGNGSNFNYEIELTGSHNAKLFLDWANGKLEPTSLYVGTITGTGVVQGNTYTSSNPYHEFTSYQKNGTVLGTLTSGGSIVDHVICFMAGTMILTPSGEVAVETLKAGDMVLTADGKTLPVRWLGRSTIVSRFADPLRAAPILIKAGALGEALPERDLRVSPAHALFLDGKLVEAGALVNGTSIMREAMEERFNYYHVELASHELLVSNGVASESFVDNVERLHFDNWAEHEALASAMPIAEMELPRVKATRQVPQSLRARLAVCAAALAPVAEAA